MNCAYCERVTNIVEKDFFTCNDLVLAAIGSEECTLNHFWQFFAFWGILVSAKLLLLMTDPSVQIGTNELCLLRKGDYIAEESFFIWNNLLLAAKSSKDCTPNHFWQIFSFLRNFSVKSNFYFLWSTLLSDFVQMNCASCERVTNIVEESFFTWNELVLAARSSKECTPNFFDKF